MSDPVSDITDDCSVHVLLPAYGPSPYLPEALASVLAAADSRTFVTVVDDGSPAGEVRRAAAASGPRVQYVRLDRNRGVAGAFQACVDVSRGDYTVLMGSDDLLGPSYLSEVRRLVRHYDRPAMVLPGVRVIGPSGDAARPLADRVKSVLAPRRTVLLSGDRLAASLLVGNWLYFPATAWRTDRLQEYGFRQDMQTVLDLDLVLRLVFDGEALACSTVPAFSYRRHAASVSSLSAVSGTRYAEERDLFRWAQGRAAASGWTRSRWAAVLHPTARMHVGVVRTAAALAAAQARLARSSS